MTQVRAKADSVREVQELNGWITTQYAGEILGIQLSSINVAVYAGKINAVRMSGILLLELSSVMNYKSRREIEEQERADKARKASLEKQVQERLAAEMKKREAEIRAQIEKELLTPLSPDTETVLTTNHK